MGQLGLFEHQDLKGFAKWDSGCEIPGEGGTSTGEFRMLGTAGWNGGGRNFGCEGRPDVMATGEFRTRGTSGCNGGGVIPGAMGVWV